MKLEAYECPACGGKVILPDDGRISFFCTYCGAQLTLLPDDSIKDLIPLKEAEVKVKEADVKLKRADVDLKKADVLLKQEDRKLYELNSDNKNRTLFIILGIFLILLGIALGVGGYILGNYDNSYMMIFVFLPCLLVLSGIILLILPYISESAEQQESKIAEVKKEIESLQEELRIQQKIFDENLGPTTGAKAQARKLASSRIKMLTKEIKSKRDYLSMLTVGSNKSSH